MREGRARPVFFVLSLSCGHGLFYLVRESARADHDGAEAYDKSNHVEGVTRGRDIPRKLKRRTTPLSTTRPMISRAVMLLFRAMSLPTSMPAGIAETSTRSPYMPAEREPEDEPERRRYQDRKRQEQYEEHDPGDRREDDGEAPGGGVPGLLKGKSSIFRKAGREEPRKKQAIRIKAMVMNTVRTPSQTVSPTLNHAAGSAAFSSIHTRQSGRPC